MGSQLKGEIGIFKRTFRESKTTGMIVKKKEGREKRLESHKKKEHRVPPNTKVRSGGVE